MSVTYSGHDHSTIDQTRLLTVEEVCEYLKVSKDTWAKWRAKDTAPPALRIPNGQLRIVESDLMRWLAALSATGLDQGD